MNKIEANHVDFYYGDFHALKNISLSIPENQVREINILTAFQSNE